MAEQRICAAQGPGWSCERPADGRTYCGTHKTHMRRYGEVRKIRGYTMPKPCTVVVDDIPCTNMARYAGICAAHYRQRKAGREFSVLRPPRPRECTAVVDGTRCTRPHRGRGYCAHHLEQFKAGRPFSWPGEGRKAYAERMRAAGRQPAAKPKPARKKPADQPSAPWVGTLPHKPVMRRPVPDDMQAIHLSAIRPVTRAEQVRALGALLAVAPDDMDGQERRELELELAAMLTAPIQNTTSRSA